MTRNSTLSREQIRDLARAELVRRGKLSVKRDCERTPEIVGEDGVITYPLHAGQLAAWSSMRRIIAVFAGWQSGKTVIGPYWLMREIQRRGPGDYAVIAPDHPMLRNKARPEMERVFAGLYRSSGDEWILNEEGEVAIFGAKQAGRTRILFRHAQAPEAIEAFTLKGLWVDEPGQISDAVWRAIKPRCMVHRARMLLTARPYEHNWYVREMWEPVMDTATLTRRVDAPDDIEVVNFPSAANPAADVEYIEAQRATMPEAEYLMRYFGIPSRPATAVYDCFDERVHVYRDNMPIPDEWPKYIGLDFGPDNTAAVLIAGERELLPTGRWGDMTGRFYAYAEYHDGGKTAEEHVQAIAGTDPRKFYAVGGNKTGEQGWRGYYTAAGLMVHEPKERLYEVGIQYVYRLLKLGRLYISKECPKLINDIKTLAYDADDQGESTGKISPATRSKFHLADAMRYIAQTLFESAVIDDPEPVKPGTMAYYNALDEMYANRHQEEDGGGWASSAYDD